MFAQMISLVLGVIFLNFDMHVISIFVVLFTTISTQYVFYKIFKLKYVAKSAIITGLSLCLLLRSNSLAIYMLAGFLSIASKFLIRYKNKHIFNPAIFGAVSVLLLTDSAWVSPGQWGALTWTILLLIAIGMIITTKSHRLDVAIAFILTYVLLIFLRGVWLEEPLSLINFQVRSGAVLLFAFFTISDPSTTPDSRWGRIIFGVITGFLALLLKFYFYNAYYLLYALALTYLLVPLINYIFTPSGNAKKEERLVI